MNLKHLIAVAVLAALSAPAAAQQHVDGYVTRHGTYVAPYIRSTPDANPYNNYSSQGNANPYNGRPGYVNPNPPSGYGGYTTQPYSYGGYSR